MKKIILISTLLCGIFSFETKAFFNPGDTVALMKILMNSIQQLVQLKKILKTGKDSALLVKEINKGIHDVINLAHTAFPEEFPELYKEWKNVDEAMEHIEKIYGVIKSSPNEIVFRHIDKTVAESISFNNKLIDHAKQIDKIGDEINQLSKLVSPKGAVKLTAQGIGVMLQVQNHSLRTQSAILKLQAQKLAVKNKKEKEETNFYLESSKQLSHTMKAFKPSFKAPRF